MNTIFSIRLSPIKLAIADIYFDAGQQHWMIARINVPKEFRGLGHGSSLLRQICAEADQNQAVLALGISPSDGFTFRQLDTWYRRYGFNPVDGQNRAFRIRQPREI
jgi:GNAT superfamily N-acetyltransferase